LAALLALGGTYWSGERAAKAASETVTKQLFGETEKSRAEFLRGQRQVLYSRIIGHERQVLEAEGEVGLSNPSHPDCDLDPNDCPRPEIRKKLSKAYSSLATLESDVPESEIIASAEVRGHIKHLIEIHHQILYRLYIDHGGVRVGSGPPSFTELNAERSASLEALYVRARKEMGAE
jgi:hypothetical protein